MSYKTNYISTPKAKGTSPDQQESWRQRNPDELTPEHLTLAKLYLDAIADADDWSNEVYNRIVRTLARAGHLVLPKAQIRKAYLQLVATGQMPASPVLADRLRKKPTRSMSGVAPVTVLMRPYPCPGKCIFCPTDIKMPKSYLSNEPGAMRALILEFDPFEQTYQRIEVMQRLGHQVGKVELLILGGTFSSYRKDEQVWFVRRCFDAMNENQNVPAEMQSLEDEIKLLLQAHSINEKAAHRNTGLVIETRPDHINEEEVHWLRLLGVTRIQLGVQSLDDRISKLNKRGETSEDVRRAMRLLRGSGMKIACHYMPNLLGASPESDLADFRQFWDDPAIRPDEMKLYPTGLIRGTELYEHYERGEYRPYTEEELTDLLIACKKLVPRTCRLNRVMRDIPAPDIAAGVITSNLRQELQKRLNQAETPCQCIRCREVKRELVTLDDLHIERLAYDTDHSREVFISAVTASDKLAGFLRLSLPIRPAPIKEIRNHALVRQVQVYGSVVGLKTENKGRAQHQGIGTWLMQLAIEEATNTGYRQLSVIAAIGTRNYYRRFGFKLGNLYMSREIHYANT